MREFKTRVWNRIREKIYYASHGQNKLYTNGVFWKMTDNNGVTIANASYGDKLMQYIGLEDKNGKEVYEGDIVRYYDCMTKTNGIGYVDFSDASFRINGFIKAYRWMDYEIEVLGNIYENPDLLE